MEKPTKDSKVERAKLVDEAIRLVWASLESHLMYTHTKDEAGYGFHKQTTKEYARLIQILTELY